MARLGLETQGRLGTDRGMPGRDRGSGAALPTADLRRGDAYWHTGAGCLFVYGDAGWRQAHTGSVADAAARTALPSGLLYAGMRVRETGSTRTWEWTGTAWRFVAGPPEWQTPTYLNGWVNYGETFQAGRYALLPSGEVEIQGLVKSGTANHIFTMPAGYRPAATLILATVANPNALGRLDITAGGEVVRLVGDPAFFSINCKFMPG